MIDKNERHAIEDFAEIAETAAAILKVSGTYEESGTACLVDGSMYSPSTRALKGGNHAFYIEDDGASLETYTEKLDELTEEWNGADHGASMYWDEGCLWLTRDDVEVA